MKHNIRKTITTNSIASKHNINLIKKKNKKRKKKKTIINNKLFTKKIVQYRYRRNQKKTLHHIQKNSFKKKKIMKVKNEVLKILSILLAMRLLYSHGSLLSTN